MCHSSEKSTGADAGRGSTQGNVVLSLIKSTIPFGVFCRMTSRGFLSLAGKNFTSGNLLISYSSNSLAAALIYANTMFLLLLNLCAAS